MFDNIDLDGGGEVDAEELCKSFQRMGEDITVEKAQMMIDLYDKDGSGTMGFNEFVLVMTKVSAFESRRSSARPAVLHCPRPCPLHLFPLPLTGPRQ